MGSIICEICGDKLTHKKEPYLLSAFYRHIKKEHGLTKGDYFVKFIHNGKHPTCACGCGNKVNVMKGWDKWRKYYEDHKNSLPMKENVKEKLRENQKKKKESLWYYRNVDIEIINNSFDDFINCRLTLLGISRKYGYDSRTLRDMWVAHKKITIEGYKKITYRNNGRLGSETKNEKIENDKEFIESVHKFILDNKYKYTIEEINRKFGSKYRQTTLYKYISKIYGDDFSKYLKYGNSSKEEDFFVKILRFYFGKGNVKQGFKLEDKIFDVLLFKKIIIEYDGSYYHNTIEQLANDKLKDEIAVNNGYVILRCNEKSAKNIDFLKQIEKWKNIV